MNYRQMSPRRRPTAETPIAAFRMPLSFTSHPAWTKATHYFEIEMEVIMQTVATTVSLGDQGLRLDAPGRSDYFNYYWLRDKCTSSFDPDLRERTFDITALSDAARAKDTFVEDGDLVIHWRQEYHRTRFALEWLFAFKGRGGRTDPADLPRKLWRAGHSDHFPRFRQ